MFQITILSENAQDSDLEPFLEDGAKVKNFLRLNLTPSLLEDRLPSLYKFIPSRFENLPLGVEKKFRGKNLNL